MASLSSDPFDELLATPPEPRHSSQTASPSTHSPQSLNSPNGGADRTLRTRRSNSPYSFAPTSPSVDAAARFRSRMSTARDLNQFVSKIAHDLGLKDDELVALKRFSKLSDEERELWTAGQVIKIASSISVFQAPEVPYQIPARMEASLVLLMCCSAHLVPQAALEKAICVIILNPHAASYRDEGTLKLVIAALQRQPSSGFASIEDDGAKVSVVESRASIRLGQRLNQIKLEIYKSIGKPGDVVDELTVRDGASDVIALTSAILAICKKHVKVNPSIPLVARVAYLRTMFMKARGDDEKKTNADVKQYWQNVDSSLQALRKNKENDVKRITKYFARNLERDRKIYGSSDAAFGQLAPTAATVSDSEP
ncbi:hypothetical protein K488DRAFT_74684 [Vararia minispora EC-137]|uniref:Uncharacterized protein n=1 Tax=Vararia minispora EC-137 TaxID=1314806 RepID=A0ACB8Q6J4_9AGAM|nr:hypothetical protein K488DRAFT_74684 [Vararia minispora EC-137]